MSIDDYLKDLNIDQLYSIKEKTKQLIEKHNEQERVPVWVVVSDGIGVSSFRHYENAARCLMAEVSKNRERLASNGNEKAPKDLVKRCKVTLSALLIPESEAEGMCEDWHQTSPSSS